MDGDWPTGPGLAGLLPDGRRVRDDLAAQGERLTRRALAARLRDGGRSVSNERASALVRPLNSEHRATVDGNAA